MKDISGQKFGKLTAIAPTDRRYNRHVVWHCKCDCGRDAYVPICSLISGGTKSCGCLKHSDLVGQRFGKLTVKKYVGSSTSHYAMWECICDCGNTAIVSGKYLLSGGTRSCGCLVSETDHSHGPSSDEVDGTKLSTISGKLSKRNKSGIRGVSWISKREKWEAFIHLKGKRYHLGLFATLEEAAEARREAEQELYDPILEAGGMPPTSEEEYQANLRAAIKKNHNQK